MSTIPKISIITVVRNGEKHIEHTIQSIIEQSYTSIEYIIIDGNSTDNTVNIIKKYNEKITYWVSEEDEGIYDAMNKGVKSSSGDWLLFINSDDFLINNTVIEEAASYLKNSKSLIVYGNAVIIYNLESESIQGAEWNILKYKFRNIRMNLSHQATFHSRKLFINQLFDTSFKIAGDYNLLLSYLKDHDADYIPLTIAKRRAIGISATVGTIKLLMETRKAQINNQIYKSIPSSRWLVSAFRTTFNDRFIRMVGIRRKNQLKRLLYKKP